MIEEITSPPFLDDTAQEMVTKLQTIANNINNNAGQVSYSNTSSHLQAETVQTAIDEVKGITDTINQSLATKVNVVTLSASVEVTYADTSTIGYRTTEQTKVNITTLPGYPTGKTVVATIAYGTESYGDIAFVDNSNYLRMASKTSGTKGAKVVVMYY